MDINFAGGSYETFSKNLNAQECVNFFTHIDSEGGVNKLSLRATPGLKVWKDTGKYASVRGAIKFGPFAYVVVGNAVYRLNSSKAATLCSGSLGTSTGAVSMAKNDTQVMLVDGRHGYIISALAVTSISDDGFPDKPTTVTEQDRYFIVTSLGSSSGNISDLGDGTSWDSTWNFNTNADTNALAVISDHRDLFMLSEDSFAVWYNSGDDPPFTRKPGTTQEVGIAAKDSVVQLDNTLFFLTDDNQIVRLQGYNPTIISTRSIEYQIAQYSKKDDAVGMAINIEGNAFYVLTFPTANETWCYNAAAKFWHKLTSYPNEGRWRGNCYVNLNGTHLVGDYKNGIIYELDFETFADNSEPSRRVRTISAIQQEGKLLFHHRLEVFFESGVGIITGQGSDPMAMLQYSDDGGHTWSSELWRSVGKIGKYEWRAIWNRLGSARHRNYRLIVTDPVKWVVIGADLEVSQGVT